MKVRIAIAAAIIAASIPAIASAVPASAATSYLPCSPNKTDNLTYRGGLIEFNPQVTL